MEIKRKIKRGYRTSLWLISAALTLALVGCHGNVSPELLRTCQRGEKFDGGCKNPDRCENSTDCLDGFKCETHTCTPIISCDQNIAISPDDEVQRCGGGKCVSSIDTVKNGVISRQWICINPPSCVPNQPGLGGCLSGYYCANNNTCTPYEPPKSCDTTKCSGTRGTCTENGCADRLNQDGKCDSDDNCMVGKVCNNNKKCVDEDKACGTSNSGGVCDPHSGKFVNPKPCGDTGNKRCLNDYYCNKNNRCVENSCNSSRPCQEGVCENGVCKNSDNCQSDDQCIGSDSVCVTDPTDTTGTKGKCVSKVEECKKQGCVGNQKCEKGTRDRGTFTCDNADSCENANDCKKGYYCNSSNGCVASKPSECKSFTNFESEFQRELSSVVRTGKPVKVTVCNDGSDDYTYSLIAESNRSFLVTLDVDTKDIGKGDLDFSCEVTKGGSNHPCSMKDVKGEEGKIRKIVKLSPNDESFTIKVTAVNVKNNPITGENKIGDGIHYSIYVQPIDSLKEDQCFHAKKIPVNTTVDSSYTGKAPQAVEENSTSKKKLTAKVYYRLVVDNKNKKMRYQISVKPKTTGEDIHFRLLKDCLSDNSPLLSDSNNKSFELEDGEYFLEVYTENANNDVEYILTISPKEAKCFPSKFIPHCVSPGFVEYCTKGYEKVQESCVSCSGPSPDPTKCKLLVGRGCASAIDIGKQYSQVYDATINSPTNVVTTIQTSPGDECAQRKSYKLLSSPDVTYKATIPPGESLKGYIRSLSKDQRLMFYIIDAGDGTCNSTGSCLSAYSGIDPANRDNLNNYPTEAPVYYKNNDTSAEKHVLIVVKLLTNNTPPANFEVELRVEKDNCSGPGMQDCLKHRELATCNEIADRYISYEACPRNKRCEFDPSVSKNVCMPAEPPTCASPTVIQNGDVLIGEKFVSNPNSSIKMSAYDKAGDCQQKFHGLSAGQVNMGSTTNVYSLEANTGDRVQVVVSSDVNDNRERDGFIVWVAKKAKTGSVNVCSNTSGGESNFECLSASDVFNLSTTYTDEVLEFVAPSKGDYYVFVSANKTGTEQQKTNPYTLKVNVMTKNESSQCDKYQSIGTCDSENNQIIYCDDMGFERTVKCQNGCEAGSHWCKSLPPASSSIDYYCGGTVEGQLCEYPYVSCLEGQNGGKDSGYIVGSLYKKDQRTSSDVYYGRQTHIGEDGKHLYGRCAIGGENTNLAKLGDVSRIYAFKLNKGETLHVQSLYKANNNEMRFFLLENCFAYDSCQMASDSGRDLWYYSDSNDKVVYLVVNGQGQYSGAVTTAYPFRLFWKITKTEPNCAANGGFCTSGNTVNVCLNGGALQKEFKCPDSTSCRSGICWLGDAPSNSSCTAPISIPDDGSYFLFDPTKGIKMSGSTCPSKYKYKAYFKVNLKNDHDIILLKLKPTVETSPDGNYAAYIMKESACKSTLDKTICSSPTTKFSKDKDGVFKYDGPTTMGNYTVVLLSKDESPAEVSIYTRLQSDKGLLDCSNTTAGTVRCQEDNGIGYIEQCTTIGTTGTSEQREWKRILSCPATCETGEALCAIKSSGLENGGLDGDSPYTAIPLNVVPKDSKVSSSIISMKGNFDTIKKPEWCPSLSATGSDAVNGPDRYYRFRLQKGKTFTARLCNQNAQGDKFFVVYVLGEKIKTDAMGKPVLDNMGKPTVENKGLFNDCKKVNTVSYVLNNLPYSSSNRLGTDGFPLYDGAPNNNCIKVTYTPGKDALDNPFYILAIDYKTGEHTPEPAQIKYIGTPLYLDWSIK